MAAAVRATLHTSAFFNDCRALFICHLKVRRIQILMRILLDLPLSARAFASLNATLLARSVLSWLDNAL